jgi:uncharacterized SAM-dependent methyltransferase
MLYFKKSELAKTYHISQKTVTNWIRETKDGKLNLELYVENNKAWIANTTKNITLIEELVERRRKYRNSRGVKTISPKPEFYKLYTPQQIFDIASNLDIRREFPFKYAYVDGGADYWNKYATRLANEMAPNILNSSIEQLQTNQDYIDHLINRHQRVNVIDVGPGNAIPAKAFLQHLLGQGKVVRYVALDISPAMLKIAERNIREWFGDKVTFVAREADIAYDRFTDIFAEYAAGDSSANTVNVILAFGGTFVNMRSPDGAFKVIHDSMNRDDLLVYHLKLDSEAARHYFDFGVGDKMPVLDTQTKMILDLLNVDESFYDVEMGYDAQLRQRYIRIRLKVELGITFTFEKGKRILNFNKNETILLWRYWHQDTQEVLQQLQRNDFDVLQSSLTKELDYLLTVSRVKSER